MDLAFILEQPQRNTMHRSISPPLIKEPSRAIQMLEIVLISFRPPKFHVCDLEITPEMTRAIPIRFHVVFRPPLTIDHPLLRVVLVHVFGMCGDEFFRLGPQGGNAIRRIVEVDGEAVGLVVVLHPAENVIIDFTKEVDFGLDTPVVADVFKSGVFVEHAAVPAAHLVVGYQGPVLDFLLFEHLCGFVEEIAVDPVGDGPVFFWYYLCGCSRLA